MLLEGAAALADVELTVGTPALGVDQEGEGRAAAHAAVVHELLVLREDAALAAFLRQLLLHLAAQVGGEEKQHIGQDALSQKHLPGPPTGPATTADLPSQ